MKRKLLTLPVSKDSINFDTPKTCVGRIVGITDDDRAEIDYPGNPSGPIVARSLVQESCREDLIEKPVMLLFENNDPGLPIITGIIHNKFIRQNIDEKPYIKNLKRHEVALDGKKMVFEADKEIVLRCGKSVITLKANGKVVVKGKNLVSRASMTNKIKGANVNIN